MKQTRILYITFDSPEICQKAVLFSDRYREILDIEIECSSVVISMNDDFNFNFSKHFDIVVTLDKESEKQMPVLVGLPVVLHNPIGKSNDNLYTELKMFISSFFSNGFFSALINQRRQNEHIFSSINEGILAHTTDRKIFYYSKRAEEILGVKKSDVLGKDCHVVFPQMLCGENCSYCSADENEQTQKNYRTIFLANNGIRKEIDIKIEPLRDEKDSIYGAVATLNDISYVSELRRNLSIQNDFHGIIGTDSKMENIFELIKSVAISDFPVAINGESGTGKELVANAIHEESARRNKLFVPINCGALPDGTLESELFGHVKGSFTGASRDKKGRFELADGGTLFLDEIGEMPLNVQVKLLRVIQEGVIEPVGSENARKVDVRILSATNKNLKELVKNGEFREDLYYRLAVVPIELPALRERRNDIPIIANSCLTKVCNLMNRSSVYFSPETIGILTDYNWPGNVRQLQNAIQYSMIKCFGNRIMPEHLPPELFEAVHIEEVKEREISYHAVINQPVIGRRKLSDQSVLDAIIRTGGNKAKAARHLSVGRATLYNFINSNSDLKQKIIDLDN